MNSVYDRPLFANRKQKRRDARTKLLNMGGIVASSPELMQAVSQAPRSMNQGGYVAGYDAGGHVHPHTGTRRLSDATAPFRQGLSDGLSIAGNTGLGIISALGGGGESVLNVLGSLVGKPDFRRDAAEKAFKTSGESFTDAIDILSDPGGFKRGMANAAVVNESDAETIEDLETTPGPKTLEINARQAELLAETRQKLADAEQLLKDKKLSEDAKADAAADLVGKGLQGTDKERAAQYKDLIEDVFGKKTSANTIKGLNKQLIGFTIAAGKSPRAVQNIAAGMIAGAKTEKADIAKEQERTDAMSTLALNQMFSEKAAFNLAEAQKKVAEARAGTGFRDPRSAIDAFDNARSLAIESWRTGLENQGSNYRPPDAKKGETLAQYGNRLGQEAVDARKILSGGAVDVSKTAGTAKTQPVEQALKILKGDPSSENIKFFKETYPNNIEMLKTIGLE